MMLIGDVFLPAATVTEWAGKTEVFDGIFVVGLPVSMQVFFGGAGWEEMSGVRPTAAGGASSMAFRFFCGILAPELSAALISLSIHASWKTA
jgi:hypothetical protein